MKTAEQFAKEMFPRGFPELSYLQWLDCIEAAQKHAYAAGQEAMRQAAMLSCYKAALDCDSTSLGEFRKLVSECRADEISKLPIQPLPTDTK